MLKAPFRAINKILLEIVDLCSLCALKSLSPHICSLLSENTNLSTYFMMMRVAHLQLKSFFKTQILRQQAPLCNESESVEVILLPNQRYLLTLEPTVQYFVARFFGPLELGSTCFIQQLFVHISMHIVISRPLSFLLGKLFSLNLVALISTNIFSVSKLNETSFNPLCFHTHQSFSMYTYFLLWNAHDIFYFKNRLAQTLKACIVAFTSETLLQSFIEKILFSFQAYIFISNRSSPSQIRFDAELQILKLLFKLTIVVSWTLFPVWEPERLAFRNPVGREILYISQRPSPTRFGTNLW